MCPLAAFCAGKDCEACIRRGFGTIMGVVMEFRRQIPPVQQRRSSADELSRLAELFGLVADRTRAAILYTLSDSKELTASQLVAAVGSPKRRSYAPCGPCAGRE